MKKYLYSLFVAFLFFNFSFSQFYVGGNIGYGIGSTPRVNGQEVKVNGDAISTSNIYGSYGEGFNGALKFGYFFDEHLGVELNIGYLNGADQTKADVVIGIDGYPINNNIAATTEATAYTRLFRSTLSLIYRTEIGFYGKFGFYIPLGGNTYVEANDFRIFMSKLPGVEGEVPLEATTSYKQEIHGSPTIGFEGAVGYTYALSGNWNLFAEFEYLGLSIKTKDADYTRYDQTIAFHQINGGAVVAVTTIDDLGKGKHTKYVDTVKSTDNYPGNPGFNKTQEVIDFKQSGPYDSFGINFGITYTFNDSE
ncbi:MAG: hypothetical protein ABFR05_04660 [Bacteroidota bacterium]